MNKINIPSLAQLKQLIKPGILSHQNISIGLDLGSAYVKAVSLEKSKEGINIAGFAFERINNDAKGSIRNVISKLAVNNKELAISVCGQRVALRYVNMPVMNNDEMAKAMNFELEKYIPFNKAEVNFDFTVLKKNKNTGKMLVLIAAARKELINEKFSICRELGYLVNFIDVCPLAVANYFEFINSGQQGVFAVINLGASLSSVDIIEDGVLVLSRDIFIGGNDFTKKISEVTNKNPAEAEELKLNLENDTVELIKPLESIFNNLLKEIKVSYDFYENQADRLIDKTFITGGCAKLKGLLEFLQHSLGQNIELITFNQNQNKLKIKPSLSIEEFKKDFNYYTVALGIGLRRFC